ncbi:hypothetical protein ACW9H6_26450 [Pseudomonas sp. SDO528_S397]
MLFWNNCYAPQRSTASVHPSVVLSPVQRHLEQTSTARRFAFANLTDDRGKVMRVPEGIRRVCIVLGTLLAIGSITYFIEEGDFIYADTGTFLAMNGVVMMAFTFPFMVYMTYAWVRAGFQIETSEPGK